MSDQEVSIFEQGQLPAHLQGAAVDETAAAMITTSDSIARISLKGFTFTLMHKDNDPVALAQRGAPLSLVILAIDPPNKRNARAYYAEKYTGNDDDSPPTCSSANGVTPDGWIDEPICSACASCPMSVFGADQNDKGKDIRPCGEHKRIIVVPADNIDAAPASIKVPVMSLKALSAYGRQLVKNNVSPTAVLTEFSFDADEEYPRLKFKANGFLDADTYNAAVERAASDELQDLLHPEPTDIPAKLDAPANTESAPVKQEEPVDGKAVAAQKKLVLTKKAAGFTLEQFLNSDKWTEEN